MLSHYITPGLLRNHTFMKPFFFLNKLIKRISYYLKTRKAEREAAWLRSVGVLKGAVGLIGMDAVSAMQRGGLVVAFMMAHRQVTPSRDMWRAPPLPPRASGGARHGGCDLITLSLFRFENDCMTDRMWHECIMDANWTKLYFCFFILKIRKLIHLF